MAHELGENTNEAIKLTIAEKIEEIVLNEKHLFPNLDFYSSLVYYFLGIPTILFTPLFAVARISGWSAHIMEQRALKSLIRPLAAYIGPLDKVFIPIKERI